MHEKEELLTMKQVQKLLGKSRSTIHNYIKQGMPYIKKGRNNFFRKEDVLNWVWQHDVSDDYFEMMLKAKERHSDDPLGQIHFFKKNASLRTCVIGMIEIMQSAFIDDDESKSNRIYLPSRMLDYFGRGMMFMAKHLQVQDNDFLYILNRIDSFIIEVIKQRYAYKYKLKKFNSFWDLQEKTLEEKWREEHMFYSIEEHDKFFVKKMEVDNYESRFE